MDTPMDRDSSIRKLAELIGEIRIGMLTTKTADGSFRSRPMKTQQAEFDGKLWFFTKRDSAKVEELRFHPRVTLSYAKPEHNIYISISGTAAVFVNQLKAQELWDARYNEWFPQGPTDPALILIRVTVEQAEYWNAPSSVLPLDAGFVVLAPERRDNPEFHAKVAGLREFGPVITLNAPCSTCGMFHMTSFHRAFPNLCGSGGSPREAEEDLIRRLTNEKEIHRDSLQHESVERAIAEVRAALEKSA